MLIESYRTAATRPMVARRREKTRLRRAVIISYRVCIVSNGSASISRAAAISMAISVFSGRLPLSTSFS